MEDFNLPSLERVALLERLQDEIGSVPKYFWAACQICDLTALENFVELARISPAAVRVIAGQAYAMVLYWTQSSKESSRNTTPKRSLGSGSSLAIGSSPASSPLAKRQKTTNSPGEIRRSQRATDLAKERDSNCCVLTSSGVTEVAHIYPFYRLKDLEEDIFGARHTFWDLLRNFWPKEKVTAWETELFPRGVSKPGGERVDNLITLSLDAHGQWKRGAFALKPIFESDDKMTLKVQFVWQRKQKDTPATLSLLTTPLSTIGLDQNNGAFDYGITTLHNTRSNRIIESAEIFELKTDDPIKKPLPSFKLLELQWFLTRIVGMAGAAFPYEAGWGDDSDDEEEEIPDLDLDENWR